MGHGISNEYDCIFSVHFALPALEVEVCGSTLHKAVPDASCLKYVNFQGPCQCR